MSRTRLVLPIVLAIALLALSVGGVFAVWSYPDGTENAHHELFASLNGFSYKIEDMPTEEASRSATILSLTANTTKISGMQPRRSEAPQANASAERFRGSADNSDKIRKHSPILKQPQRLNTFGVAYQFGEVLSDLFVFPMLRALLL